MRLGDKIKKNEQMFRAKKEEGMLPCFFAEVDAGVEQYEENYADQ